MQSFGFKIVEKSRTEIVPIVERAALQGRPLEVGLYFGDRDAHAYLAETLPGLDRPVVVHLDHRRLSLIHFPGREAELRQQLGVARDLGADYVITHVAPYPMTPRPERLADVLGRLAEGAAVVVTECREHGLGAYLENTFHDLDFYGRLYAHFGAHGLSDLHFCFDLGHGKVWSTRPLAEWLDFSTDLSADGRRLHVHLHANRGLVDDHMSFVQAETLGLTAPDAYCGEGGYWGALARIARDIPEANKIFEVPAAEALDNMELVMGRLGQAAEDRPDSTFGIGATGASADS